MAAASAAETDYCMSAYGEEEGEAATASMVILDLHRCRDTNASFAILDNDDEQAEAEEEQQQGQEQEQEQMMLPLALSQPATPKQKIGTDKRKQEKQKKLHPMLPSQTTVCQRNEDTRP